MFAVRKKLDPHKRKHTFELFGYDFILDEDFNVWLIEVNTNPCIEESSNLLKMLVPRMLEDMLRITVDRTFPKIRKMGKKNYSKKLKKPLDRILEEDSPADGGGSKDEDEERLPKSASPQKRPSATGSRTHPVDGYSDTENMWEKVWNLEK
jgi:hypothetical protein